MTIRQSLHQRLAIAACAVLLFAGATRAADAPGSNRPGSNAPGADEIRPNEIIRRYIPASRLDAVAGRDAPGALLPIAEFEALLNAAAANAANAGPRPSGAGLVKADYALRVEGERFTIACKVTLRSFDAAWQTVRLPVQGLSILSARFEGDETPPRLARDPKQPDELLVVLAEPGSKTLLLELTAPLTAAGGDAASAFQLVNAPLGELTLTLPAGKRLQVNGLLLDRPAADDQPADYRVAIGGRPDVRLVITDRKAIDRTDSMTFASTAIGILATPGEATWTAVTQLTVFGRPLDKLECEVPSTLEITDVESTGLEAWELNDGAPGQTRITLTWRQPFEGLRPITFRGLFSPDRDGRGRAPTLSLQNISSHTGTLLLQRPAGIRLQVTEQNGVRPVAASGTPASESGLVESHFEIWKEDFLLEFVPTAREREVQAALSTLVALGAQGADLATTIDLETRFAPLFEADILLPAAWKVLEAKHSGARASWQMVPEEAGRQRIRIPLQPPLQPGENRTLSLTAQFEPDGWPVGATPVRLALPEVRLPQAGVVEALYGITADQDLEVIPLEINGLIPARQVDVDTLNRQLAAFQRSVRLGFTYQDTAFTGQLEVRRLPARLTATCITLTRIDAEEIASQVEAQLSISGGGVRELTVRLPETVGRDLRLSLLHFAPRPLFGPPATPQPVAQQSAIRLPALPLILEQSAGSAENGQIPWTIKLDRYAIGNFVLRATLSQPRPAAGDEQPWNVPALTVVGADREAGAIGIEAADDQHVTAVARDAAGLSLEPLDPIDFPPAHVRPRERLVAAFAFDRPGWSATVAEQRLTRIAMPTAVIHQLELASVIGSQGVKQIQADATLSAVGVQSLVVRLPAEHTLWGALVDGSPVPVHRSGESLSIPLSPVDPPGRSRTVRLVYAPTADQAGVRSRVGGFTLEESPPRFLVVTGQGVEQPIAVLSSQWTVHHPSGLDLVDARGVFRPAEPLARGGLLHQLHSLMRLPATNEAVWRVGLLGVIVLVLWLFAALRSRLSISLLGCLVVLASVVLVGGSALLLQKPRHAARDWGAAATASSPPPMSVDKAPRPPEEEVGTFGRSDPYFIETGNAAGDDAFRFRAAQDRKSESAPSSDARDLGRPNVALPASPAGEQSSTPSYTESFLFSQKQADSPFAAAERRSLVRGDGLLSVAFGLQPPADSRAVVLQSTADPTGGPSSELALRFMDERSRQLWMCLAALVVAVVGWWLRRARLLTRLMFLLLTLLGPFTVRWLVPIGWLPLADGVWLGGLATAGLWLLRSVRLRVCSRPCWAGLCPPRTQTGAAIALAMLLGGLAPTLAQETTAKRPAPVDEVFIPYDNVRDPLAARNVFVPQHLFLKLWRGAHPEDAPLAEPPLSSTVAAAAFVVDLTALPEPVAGRGAERLLAPVSARLLLNNLTAGPTRLELPVQGVAIRSASLNGAPAVLDSQQAGRLVVTLPQAGPAVLDLTFELPVDRTGPAGRFRFENAPVAAGRLSLRLAKTDPAPEVRTAGGKVSAAAAEDSAVVFEIPIDRGGVQEISWQPAAARSGDDSAIQVQSTTAVTVDDAGITARSSYTAKVSQSGMTELTLAFPGSMRLKRVEGADVGGWSMDGENAGRRLTVFFVRAIESQTTFHIDAFQPAAIDARPQTVAIVIPQPEAVSRETGKVGVFVAPQLVVRAGAAHGLIQEDLTRFDTKGVAAAGPLQLAYRYAARPISLELSLQRRQAETRLQVEHGVFITQRKLRLSTRCRFQIAGAPRSSLVLQLPPDYLLLDVTSPMLADYSTATDDAGHKLLTIELDQPRTGDIELLLNGARPRRPEEPLTVLATPRVLEVSKVESQLGVWVEDLYLATADALGDWKNADPNTLETVLRGLRPTPMQFGFRSNLPDPQPVTIGLRTQSADLSADALALIAVSDASIDYGFTLQWRITRAATDTFSFTSPGWLRGKIDFAGVGVRQVTAADLPDGRVRWTVSLTDPVRDSYLLTGAAALPFPADGRVLAPDLLFESGSGGATSRLEAQRQYAVVVNLSRRPLAVEDPAAVQTVRREALPLKVPDQLVQQAMSIVQTIPGRPASWLARRVQTAEALQAAITGATLETVVAVDGSWRTQASYTLRNRGRQFLPLDLSALGKVRVLSILVKGQPARALETTVGGKALHLVPLPPSSAADLSYDVVVMLAGALPRGLPKETSLAAATLELPAPHITTPAESAVFGIPVAQTAWVVRLPDGIEAELDEAGNLTPHQAAEWELLASAQTLSQIEADTEAMFRIIADRESSDQRRSQALDNLNRLSESLAWNRRQIDEVAQRAESRLGAKGNEMWQFNSARNGALQARVHEQLQAGRSASTVRPQSNAAAPAAPLPQLQGSLNFQSNEALTVPQSGVASPDVSQSGQGRAYILGNSLSILNANTFNDAEAKDGLAIDFGFSRELEAGKPARRAGSEESERDSSRSGLKRRLAEQQQAPASDAQTSLGLGFRVQPPVDVGGGIGGGISPAPNQAGSAGMFGASSSLAAAEPTIAQAVAPIAESQWTSGAGLSLAMKLPPVGEDALAFSKTGGDPKLILRARSAPARRAAWSLAEVAIALLASVWLLSAATAKGGFARSAGIVVAIASAAAFVLLPGDARWLALLVFALAGCCLAVTRRQATTTAG